MADSKKIWKGVGITAGILLAIYVVGRLITGKWNPMNWFSSTKTALPTDCDPNKVGFQINGTENQAKCKVGGTGRIVYDTARCCQAGNPCGWTQSTHDRACGA